MASYFPTAARLSGPGALHPPSSPEAQAWLVGWVRPPAQLLVSGDSHSQAGMSSQLRHPEGDMGARDAPQAASDFLRLRSKPLSSEFQNLSLGSPKKPHCSHETHHKGNKMCLFELPESHAANATCMTCKTCGCTPVPQLRSHWPTCLKHTDLPATWPLWVRGHLQQLPSTLLSSRSLPNVPSQRGLPCPLELKPQLPAAVAMCLPP